MSAEIIALVLLWAVVAFGIGCLIAGLKNERKQNNEEGT